MTATLHVHSDDATLYDSVFEIQVKATVAEEPDWFNTTLVRITYVEPPCQLTQEDVDRVAGEQQISL